MQLTPVKSDTLQDEHDIMKLFPGCYFPTPTIMPTAADPLPPEEDPKVPQTDPPLDPTPKPVTDPPMQLQGK
jgi:hypothetical protein